MRKASSSSRILRIAVRAGVVLGAALAICITGVVGYENVAALRSAEASASLLARGKDVFARNCALCHGENLAGHAKGAPLDAPPLDKPGFAFFFYTMPKDMEGFIAGLAGSGRGNMPPFQGVLSHEDLASAAYYIGRVNLGRVGGSREQAPSGR